MSRNLSKSYEGGGCYFSTAARFLGLFFIIFTDFALKNTLKLKLNQFCFYRLKIHHITGPLAYQTSTNFTVIVFFRIFAFRGLKFSHFAPNIHLFCRFCCQKHPKIENTSFFILQAENSPHNWSIAVSNVHNVQSYLIFPNFCFCTVELFPPYTPC